MENSVQLEYEGLNPIISGSIVNGVLVITSHQELGDHYLMEINGVQNKWETDIRTLSLGEQSDEYGN